MARVGRQACSAMARTRWLAQSAQRRHAQGDQQRLARGGLTVVGLQLLARGNPVVARQGARRAPVRRGRGPRSVKQLAPPRARLLGNLGICNLVSAHI